MMDPPRAVWEIRGRMMVGLMTQIEAYQTLLDWGYDPELAQRVSEGWAAEATGRAEAS